MYLKSRRRCACSRSPTSNSSAAAGVQPIVRSVEQETARNGARGKQYAAHLVVTGGMNRMDNDDCVVCTIVSVYNSVYNTVVGRVWEGGSHTSTRALPHVRMQV